MGFLGVQFGLFSPSFRKLTDLVRDAQHAEIGWFGGEITAI